MFCIIIVSIICFIFTKNICCSDTLSAITYLGDSEGPRLFMKVSEKEPHLTPDTTTDDEMRRQICLSLTKTAYFDLYAQTDPVEDMVALYGFIRNRVEKMRGDSLQGEMLIRILENYKTEEDGRVIYTYRSKRISMMHGRQEFVYPCLTKPRSDPKAVVVHFISDPYNINAALDSPTQEPIRARFLCSVVGQYCYPEVLAEEPAITFAPPQYSKEVLENIYLKMRKSRSTVEEETNDPLCRLTKIEKLRACVSVVNSSYLVDKVRFNPDPDKFDTACELHGVSLLTDEAKTEAGVSPFEERMLICAVQSVTDPQKKYKYSLSRAHHLHHAWVYRHNEQEGWNIEFVSARISVIIDNSPITIETEGKSLPSLVDLLRQY